MQINRLSDEEKQMMDDHVAESSHVQFSQRVMDIPIGTDLPTPDEIKDELYGYCDVLLGRVDPPMDSPYLGLCELATAYFARGCELDMRLHEEERSGRVIRGHDYYRLRTGALRTFLEMTKRMAELGSRRLTQESLLFQQRHDAGETY